MGASMVPRKLPTLPLLRPASTMLTTSLRLTRMLPIQAELELALALVQGLALLSLPSLPPLLAVQAPVLVQELELEQARQAIMMMMAAMATATVCLATATAKATATVVQVLLACGQCLAWQQLMELVLALAPELVRLASSAKQRHRGTRRVQ